MKRKILIMAMAIVCLTMLFSIAAYANDISVYVDNEYVRLTDVNGTPVYPFIQNGTTYVPLRGVSQALNCQVGWDGNNKNVLIYKEMQPDGSVFRNRSDDIQVYVDNELVELKDANGTVVKPILKNGTTYIPIRGVSQALGCWVRWDGKTKTVSVYKDIVPPDGVSLTENKPYDGHNSGCYYESEGKMLDIDDKKYTNAIRFCGGGYQMFNLDGKYNKLTCVVGAVRTFELEKEVTFIVDGEIVATHIVKPNSSAKNITVDLNGGLQLKIVATNATIDSVALGDVKFRAD